MKKFESFVKFLFSIGYILFGSVVGFILSYFLCAFIGVASDILFDGGPFVFIDFINLF